MIKTTAGYFESTEWSFHVAMYLGGLTSNASFCLGTYLLIYAMPHVVVIRVRVDRIEGCERLWTASNTFLRQDDGTIGRGCPDETSHRRVVLVGPNNILKD